MYSRNNNRMVPVREGDEIDVKIEAVGEKGDGLARTQGFVLFVPNTKAGDEVRIRVTKVLKNSGFAEVIDTPSPVSASENKPQEPVEDKPSEEEKMVEELEAKSEEMDSEDFGDDSEEDSEEEKPEAEEEAEKVEPSEEEEKKE
jgi:predicted RNA-binding protein with TRAM domain